MGACMLRTRSVQRPGFFMSKQEEVTMKMLLIVMLVRAVIACIEIATNKNKNKRNISNEATAAKVQHPAETMLR